MNICNALNSGILPGDYFALVEQVSAGLIPDLRTLQLQTEETDDRFLLGGVAVATLPPQARIVRHAELNTFLQKANRVVVRHQLGKVLALFELVSPGNKASRHALRVFVEKTAEFLRNGIHVVVVDLFPPTERDPDGVHKAIWDEIVDKPFELDAEKPLTVASYVGGEVKSAYVEPIAVGDSLPEIPLFLDVGHYVRMPLESTYETTWSQCPVPMRRAVEGNKTGADS